MGTDNFSRRHALGLFSVGIISSCQSAPSATPSAVEPVQFQSMGATLSGDIHLPAAAPRAGVILVHGSGPETRMIEVAHRLALEGFAVLTYDKRGVGSSGGTYEALYNVSQDNLRLLAADASAAIDTLAAHPRLRRRQIGLFGISQAGWIIPLAAVANRRAAFMLLWCGPVCRVSDELEFGYSSPQAAAQETAARGKDVPANLEELTRRYVAQIRADGTDVDPQAQLRSLSIPGLWLFGGRDQVIPTELSIRQLRELITAGRANYSMRFLPEAAHAMQGANAEAWRISLDWLAHL